jgi:hypothetical protein
MITFLEHLVVSVVQTCIVYICFVLLLFCIWIVADATTEAGTGYPSEEPEFTSGLSVFLCIVL